jgi:flagellar assembly protein FliH
LFNVIKGEFIKKDIEPKILNYNKDKKEDNIIKSEESEKSIKQILEEEVKQKREELEMINAEILRKKVSTENEIQKMYKDADEKIEYEIKVSQNRGYQDGYQIGVEKGKEEIIQSAVVILDRIEKIHEDILNQKITMLEENEEDLIELSFNLAQKIVKKEITCDKDIIRKNLVEAMKKVPISKNLTIIVNWEDLEYIKEIKNKLFSEIHGVEKIDIVENRSIERGGCILETSMGTIDATINSQLEIVYEKLMETVQQKNCIETGECETGE